MLLPSLDAALALARQDGRVCPLPDAWCALYELLPGRRSDMYGAIPPSPLVLAGWDATSDDDKRERLRLHLAWAAEHGAIAAVHAYLAQLPESRWHHAPAR